MKLPRGQLKPNPQQRVGAAASRPPAAPLKSSGTRWGWGWLLPSLAGITLIASLFGYGVMFGALESFGLDAATVIDSPLDPLLVVWAGAVRTLDVVGMSVRRIYHSDVLWRIVVGVASFAFLAEMAARKLDRRSRRHLRPQLLRLMPQLTPDLESAFKRGGQFGFVSCLLCLLPALAYFLLIFVLLVPLIGYVAGYDYVNKYVVLPEKCGTPSTHSERKTRANKPVFESNDEGEPKIEPIQARCVLVESIDRRKPFATCGRVVLSTNKFLVLYSKDAGALRVPIADMRISPSADESGDKCRSAGDRTGRHASPGRATTVP